MRVFFQVQYDGSAYHGWQSQPNALTVQQLLEERLSVLMGSPVAVVGSGRTDAGVHAQGQWVHWECPPTRESLLQAENFVYRVNCLLPDDISVVEAWQAAHPDLHARFSAIQRHYRYSIARVKQPLLRHCSLLHTAPLDVAAMQVAAKHLLAHQDFASFCKAGGSQHTTLCKLSRAEWVCTPERWDFYISADRFLRGMVRTVVGTLLEVGQAKRAADSMGALLYAKDRTLAGRAVPAQGLSLYQVDYPEGSFLPLASA